MALVTPGPKGGHYVVALARALTDLGVRNTIHTDGDNAQGALLKLVGLVKDSFGED